MEWFFTLSTSDKISLISSISTLFIAIVAIWQSNKSIKLTEKSIRDANRPYVEMYIEILDTIYFEKNLVIKNFGNTSAKIIDLTFHTKLDPINSNKEMKSLIGSTIAPNQKFLTVIIPEFKDTIEATLIYEDLENKKYTADFYIKTDVSSDLTWTNNEKSNESDIATAIKISSAAIIKSIK